MSTSVNQIGRLGCFKVLPLIFDEALSYYEVLCKIRDTVNNLITEVSTNEDNIAELQEWVGTGSVDDRIYGAEIAAKGYAESYTDEKISRCGMVLFEGTIEPLGSAVLNDTDYKIPDYHMVQVLLDHASYDGPVLCSVHKATGTTYVIVGVGGTALQPPSSYESLSYVYATYNSSTNTLQANRAHRPDNYEDDPTGHLVGADIKQIVGLW